LPIGFRRFGLSSIVNHLIGTETPTPFDFLASGSFLRTTLDEHLTKNGLSSETTLTLECVRSLVPPLYLASFEHDDWVSAVDVLSNGSNAGSSSNVVQPGQERILSGSYDGILRVWHMSSQVMGVSSAEGDNHTSSVKSAKFLSSSKIVSSGLDRTVRLWKYTESANTTANLEPLRILYGHQASVDRIAVHSSSSRILSASSDHNVGLWSVDSNNSPSADPSLISAAPTSSKRRKISASKTPTSGPLSLLKSHTGPVSESVFSPTDSTVAYSTSWDHTLRTWDLTTSACVNTRTTSHPLLSLAGLPAVNLLATGTSARHITLIDPRASASSISAMTLRGHSNAVVSLCADPESEWGIVSGSHDGTCRIWDIRATKAGESGLVGESTYTINRQSAGEMPRRVAGDGIKVFGVLWDQSVGIVSGGQDKKVQINRGKGVTRLGEDPGLNS
jgi:WD40 repeat protein